MVGRNLKIITMRTHKQQTVEELAEYYAHNYFDMHETNNYKALKQGFTKGYNQKTDEIKDLIEKLKLTKLEHSQSSGVSVEVVDNYNAEQDRKISLLKILL